MHITDAHVGWTDWLWETDLGGSPVENDPGDLLLDRAAYEGELAAAAAAVQEMPYDELAHRGKAIPLALGVGLAHAAPRTVMVRRCGVEMVLRGQAC